MGTRTITYDDLDNNKVTRTFEFRLRKGELAEFAMKHEAEGVDVAAWLKAIAESKNASAILETVRELISLSIGERHGNRFVKNDDIRADFFESGAWDELFMQLIENPMEFAKFVQDMLPADMIEAVEQERKNAKSFTDEQLLALTDASFYGMFGDDPKQWDQRITAIAYQRKNRRAA